MNKVKKNIYWYFLPKSQKKKIEQQILKEKIINFLLSIPSDNLTKEQKDVLEFLKSNPLSTFPSGFTFKYNKDNITVYTDPENGLKYVMHENKRLYFKRKSSKRGVRRNYTNLLLEQDIQSAHRYLTDSFTVNENDIIFDIGAAEGNFTLSVIEKVKKAYLFETDPKWLEAMQATFSPWKDKIEIVNKYVSDKDGKDTVKLDSFTKGNMNADFLKIDVEGAELSVLEGAMELINSNKDIKIAICTYHNQDDEAILSGYLKKQNFEISTSSGYMIFTLDKNQRPPYLRRGLIRATK